MRFARDELLRSGQRAGMRDRNRAIAAAQSACALGGAVGGENVERKQVPGMNCTEFEYVVVAIARDEVIEAAARREGLAHADNCARCARRLASEITLSEAMAAVIADDGTKQAPPYVSKMLLEGFRERKIAGRRR